MSKPYDQTHWPSPEDSFEARLAWSETVSPAERWAWAEKHARTVTDDDAPVLAGSAGRPATREEMLAFIAREQRRIAAGG